MKTIAILGVVLTVLFATTTTTQAAGSIGGAAVFTCADTEAQVTASGAAWVSAGGSTIYFGYRQFGANQNPIVRSFGANVWCREDYETSTDDGRGYGLWWDGANLYGVFSATGTGTGQNYNVWTGGGWLNSYGAGGGGQVSVILRLNPADGQPIGGTYITARLSNGNSNSARTTNISFTGGSVIVTLDSAFSPRNTDRSAMTCTNYPFTWTLELSADLSTALGSASTNCNSTSPPPSQFPGGGGAGGGGGFGYQDGRLNAYDVAPPVAIYCNPRGIAVYSVSPVNSQGTLAFIAPVSQVRQGIERAGSTRSNVEIMRGDGATLYALRSNELQVNKFDIDGKLYEFIFEADACDGVFDESLSAPATSGTVIYPTPTTSAPALSVTPEAGADAIPMIGGGLVHTVQPGENLYRIGLRYGWDYRELAQINGIDPPYTVYIGQQIYIPPQ